VWARQHGCDWDKDECLRLVVSSDIVESGQLEMLQWMREHEGVWDERICEYAEWYDKLEVLQWAKANNCPGAENY
jgi:hypothetical protein